MGRGVPHLSRPPPPERNAILLWWAVGLCLAVPACWLDPVPLSQPIMSWPAQAQTWVMQPVAGWHQPLWSWWTTAWLHGSDRHLQQNLIGTGFVLLLGSTPHARLSCAVAWLMAWPLTHLLMLLQPGLDSYVGLSGVLHAGLAVWCMHQITQTETAGFKWMGWIVLAGMICKIFMENPWQRALIQPTGSDITVAPWAHLSGLFSGLLVSGLFHACTAGSTVQTVTVRDVHSFERSDETPGNFRDNQ